MNGLPSGEVDEESIERVVFPPAAPHAFRVVIQDKSYLIIVAEEAF
jgi:hypothetical protein